MTSFQKMQETVGSVAWGDLMVVMGDINAGVGCDVSIWGEVLGRNGEEVCNENGRELLQFSVSTTSGWFLQILG